ncbi:hypothetical protein NA57DRAFT_76292 [Rhizodiscina lignyota]|uniref:Transcription factor domain-containing protein n=1 Tax=Rhizodiscina lignyota TaxID=1504668 RepID=A0A9P4M5V2_9PEZI|nr:hypothetical protein NA57DRAFT_76292 [Rhizodiscina lignyota]
MPMDDVETPLERPIPRTAYVAHGDDVGITSNGTTEGLSLQNDDFTWDCLNLPLSFSPVFGMDLTPGEPSLGIRTLDTDSQQPTTTPTLFQPKGFANPASKLSAGIATAMLRGYPEMMRSCDTVPPFFHPHCYEVNGERKVPAPLVNIMSIAQMFHRREENKGFIWQNVDRERKRLVGECDWLDADSLLAALQALCVACLMRFVDGETEIEDFDFQLLTCVNKIATRLVDVTGNLVAKDDLEGRRMTWNEWIFAECKRRTLLVFRVLQKIVHLDILLPCPTLPEYAAAPLPASKQLWRASTAEDWERARDYDSRDLWVHGMLKDGSLAALKDGVDSTHRRIVDWDRWYAGVDELGVLAVLSANIQA